jgi:hypothetical protein
MGITMDEAARQLLLATRRKALCNFLHCKPGTGRSTGKLYNRWVTCAEEAR